MSDYDRPSFRKAEAIYNGIRHENSIHIPRSKGIVSPTDHEIMAALEAETRLGDYSVSSEALAGDKGIKHDEGKEPLSLLSRIWLLGVAKVMGFGAKKYAAHNWRNGIARSRLISAALRHIIAYNEGEDNDPETGLSHLDHASCCLMFARESHETHPNLDDRYKGKVK